MAEKIWCVCMFGCGKYYDGYYGTDCQISSNGIFPVDELPYKIAPGYTNIIVGVGEEKPPIEDVRAILEKVSASPSCNIISQ
jgi:hypothetical protein